MEELFSSLRRVGSWQRSASNLVALLLGKPKLQYLPINFSLLINHLYLKEKPKTRQRMESNTP